MPKSLPPRKVAKALPSKAAKKALPAKAAKKSLPVKAAPEPESSGRKTVLSTEDVTRIRKTIKEQHAPKPRKALPRKAGGRALPGTKKVAGFKTAAEVRDRDYTDMSPMDFLLEVQGKDVTWLDELGKEQSATVPASVYEEEKGEDGKKRMKLVNNKQLHIHSSILSGKSILTFVDAQTQNFRSVDLAQIIRVS